MAEQEGAQAPQGRDNRVLNPGPVIGLALSHLRAAAAIFAQEPLFGLEAREVQTLVERLEVERDGVPLSDSVLRSIEAHLTAVEAAVGYATAAAHAGGRG